MLVAPPEQPSASRNLRVQRRLCSDEASRPLSLGCTACPDRGICGGLHVKYPLYDCLDLCCGKPEACDSVCRRNPRGFVDYMREVDGFSLDNVPRASTLSAPSLPAVVPVLYHSSVRLNAFDGATAVCLPLYALLRGNRSNGYSATRSDFTARFGIAPGITKILTGTEKDRPLERWWASGSSARSEIIRDLRRDGVELVTTPNYSLFVDRPRWDNLHSIKRIAIVHSEFLDGGLSAALHVNARTDQDWSRWCDYVAGRPEVTHIAFEFATGAGRNGRISWHTDQLVRLADTVSQPLHLVVRGGLRELRRLAASFQGITVLDTSTFVKTMNRMQAIVTENGSLDWQSSPTKHSEPLDNLFAENWCVVSAFYSSQLVLDSHTHRAAA